MCGHSDNVALSVDSQRVRDSALNSGRTDDKNNSHYVALSVDAREEFSHYPC